MVDFRVHDIEKITYELVKIKGCYVLRIKLKKKDVEHQITLFSEKVSNLKFEAIK